MQTVYIYGLFDPRDNQLRYVGKTINLENRLRDHISWAIQDDPCPKSDWIKELLALGLEPKIDILEKTTEKDWAELEIKWIATCRILGLKIFNVANGGPNPPDWMGRKQSVYHVQKRVEARQAKGNYQHSEETRKKISEHRKGKATGPNNPFYGKQHSKEIMDRIIKANKGKISTFKGKHHSEETKQKISEANRGKQLSEEHKQKLSKAFIGRKMSPEFSEKLRQANLGKHLSDETKKKLRQANLGKQHSEETKQKISQLSKDKVFPADFGEKMSKIVKDKWQDPDYKAKMKEMRKKVQQENWNNPEYRAKMLEAQKRRREREALEKVKFTNNS